MVFWCKTGLNNYYYIIVTKITLIRTQETVLFTTKPVHKTVLTTEKCAVVRLRALMAQQSARLIINRPID
jgi:hypothetical protein